MIGVHVHAGVVLHAAGQLAQLAERRTAIQWAQGRSLLALEPCDRRLAGRPVHPHIGNLAHPPSQMRLQSTPGAKAPPRDGVVLDVADATLVLAFGAGAVGRAGDRPHIPVADKRMQAVGELHFTRDGIVVLDQGTGVVEQ